MNFNDNLLDISGEITEEILQFRRTFHKTPELGFQETHTSNLIKNNLKRFGIETSGMCL